MPLRPILIYVPFGHLPTLNTLKPVDTPIPDLEKLKRNPPKETDFLI